MDDHVQVRLDGFQAHRDRDWPWRLGVPDEWCGPPVPWVDGGYFPAVPGSPLLDP